jgi:hypothetical protein
MTVTTRGIDVAAASENYSSFFGRLYKPDASKRLVLAFTGGPGDDRDFITTSASASHIFEGLADYDRPVFSAQFGGADQWGNSTALDRISKAWTKAQAVLSTRTDKFIGIGISKGGTALLNDYVLNPTRYQALALFVPAVDIQDVFDNNRGGNQAAINTAHAGRPSNANNPAAHPTSYANVPITIWAASDDIVTPIATMKNFASASNASLKDMGAVGHTAANVPIDEVLRFLGPHF